MPLSSIYNFRGNDVMTRLVMMVVMIFSAVGLALAQESTLSVEPKEIRAGRSAELKWKVENADKVFISDLGKVASDGTQIVTPKETATYTLIAEGKFGVIAKTITLRVTGAKGGKGKNSDDPDPPTDYMKFQYPLVVNHKGASLVDFLNQIRRLLQDDMGFSVYGPYPSPSGNFMFVTGYKLRGDLVKPGEKTIAKRKISHMVEIDRVTSPTQEYTLTISALVKYRKALEYTWRVEGSAGFYRPECEGLKKKIESLPKEGHKPAMGSQVPARSKKRIESPPKKGGGKA